MEQLDTVFMAEKANVLIKRSLWNHKMCQIEQATQW